MAGSGRKCLNKKWFLFPDDAVEKVAFWRRRYNGEGTHRTLNLTSREFAVMADIGNLPAKLNQSQGEMYISLVDSQRRSVRHGNSGREVVAL